MKITIEQPYIDYGYYTVRIDNKFANELTIDEVIGCVASALFRPMRPLFVRTYEEWYEWHRIFCPDTLTEPIALLPLLNMTS